MYCQINIKLTKKWTHFGTKVGLYTGFGGSSSELSSSPESVSYSLDWQGEDREFTPITILHGEHTSSLTWPVAVDIARPGAALAGS